jgi:hypothetical protein
MLYNKTDPITKAETTVVWKAISVAALPPALPFRALLPLLSLAAASAQSFGWGL